MLSIQQFQKTILDHYTAHGRDLPWRKTSDPYAIVVSEIMLQQTQADRVISKYHTWLAHFPTFESLAAAPLNDVLRHWQGLGYNRRALALVKIAEKIVTEHNGKLPDDPTTLETFPGIGAATANSIVAYAFNKPVTFIETNIRSVFIHFFFKDTTEITDEELQPLVEKAVDYTNPRRWYNALMDYGVKLKKEHENPSRKSAHYTKQSKFEGSNRQLRGKMVKLLIERPDLSAKEISIRLEEPLTKIKTNLEQLRKEGFVATEE